MTLNLIMNDFNLQYLIFTRMTQMENITKDLDTILETTLERGDPPTTPVLHRHIRNQATGSKEMAGGSRRSQEQEVWT